MRVTVLWPPGAEDNLDYERSLLYTAITRARGSLDSDQRKDAVDAGRAALGLVRRPFGR